MPAMTAAQEAGTLFYTVVKINIMYIGIGTVVLILVLFLIFRRR